MSKKSTQTVFDVRERMEELRKTRDEIKKGKYNPGQMRAIASMFTNENKLYSETIKVNKMAGIKLDKTNPRLKSVKL